MSQIKTICSGWSFYIKMSKNAKIHPKRQLRRPVKKKVHPLLILRLNVSRHCKKKQNDLITKCSWNQITTTSDVQQNTLHRVIYLTKIRAKCKNTVMVQLYCFYRKRANVSHMLLIKSTSRLTDHQQLGAPLYKQNFCHFTGLKHSGVFTQRQGGQTSAMILEKQILLLINLGRLIGPFPNNLMYAIPQWERLFTVGKY